MIVIAKPSFAPALSDVGVSVLRGALVGLVIAAIAFPMAMRHATAFDPSSPREVLTSQAVPTHRMRQADFGATHPPPEVRDLANWIANTGDNATSGFVVIDKQRARAHVFDAAATLEASSAVLLGSALGDDSVPGIGDRSISQIKPEERTTPAGRFMAQKGRNALGEDVVWVDYDAAVSMHRVRTTDPAERRLERLATDTPDDNRISYGCINVPSAFYDAHVRPLFALRRGLVYVLPDLKPVREVFGSYHAIANHQSITHPPSPAPRFSGAPHDQNL